LLQKCEQRPEVSLGLDYKFLVRSLNPAAGLRIGVSTKSIETALKAYLENLSADKRQQV
jgi:ATP-dependent DNA ligase